VYDNNAVFLLSAFWEAGNIEGSGSGVSGQTCSIRFPSVLRPTKCVFLQYAYDSQDVVPNISSVPKSVFTTQRSRPHYSLQACCSTIARHSTAHLLHSSAQRRQWSISCLQHSSAQTRHISAHALQSNEAFSPPIIMSCAVETQTNEHSISSWIQGPSILTLSSLRHSDAQCLHSAAQAMHASMHRW